MENAQKQNKTNKTLKKTNNKCTRTNDAACPMLNAMQWDTHGEKAATTTHTNFLANNNTPYVMLGRRRLVSSNRRQHNDVIYLKLDDFNGTFNVLVLIDNCHNKASQQQQQ
ncbi:hypothetical protein Tsp_09034 [Trichinella spiralis]|uniref:hypothetical protein n=1 Tax=Trichinella spiralis TaxID=6334 RepID=UPI0001EFC57B|nr:hypothetical protein Tsp_09034 [Trichinella spiralis]